MKTAITELLNIEYPIVQGAMAWVADPDLASAVSNAGGLGVVGTGHDPVDVVRAKVEEMKSKTDKPFAVNAMFLSAHVDDVVDYLIEESGVKIITTGAGNPSKYMERFKKAGIVVIPVVASVAVAKRMERIGADAIVVEVNEFALYTYSNGFVAYLSEFLKGYVEDIRKSMEYISLEVKEPLLEKLLKELKGQEKYSILKALMLKI